MGSGSSTQLHPDIAKVLASKVAILKDYYVSKKLGSLEDFDALFGNNAALSKLLLVCVRHLISSNVEIGSGSIFRIDDTDVATVSVPLNHAQFFSEELLSATANKPIIIEASGHGMPDIDFLASQDWHNATVVGLNVSSNLLSDTAAVALSSKAFKSLRHLGLASNNLTNVISISMASSLYLQVLDLSYNPYLTFQKRCFMFCPQLKVLHLDGCNLRTTFCHKDENASNTSACGDSSASMPSSSSSFPSMTAAAAAAESSSASSSAAAVGGGGPSATSGTTTTTNASSSSSPHQAVFTAALATSTRFSARSINASDSDAELSPSVSGVVSASDTLSMFFGLVALEELSLRDNNFEDVESLRGLEYFHSVVKSQQGLQPILRSIWIDENPCTKLSSSKTKVISYLLDIIPSLSLIDESYRRRSSVGMNPIDISKLLASRATRGDQVGGVGGPSGRSSPSLSGRSGKSDAMEQEYLSALKGEKDINVVH